MLLPYLDKDGYEMMPEKRPVFIRQEGKAQSFVRVAKYVQCEMIKGLRWIGKCEECNFFNGHVKYHGVNCALKPTENGN